MYTGNKVTMILFALAVLLTCNQILGSAVPASANFPQDVKCQLCEGLAELVATGEKEHYDRAYIENAGERLCGFLGSYKKSCLVFVHANMDNIYDGFNKYGQATVCKELKLCDKVDPHPGFESDKNEVNQNTLEVDESQIKHANDVECSMCEAFAKLIQQMLKRGNYPEMIVAALRQACKFMGGFEKQCDEFLDKYAVKLIKFVENTDADTACKKIELCDAKMSAGKQLVKRSQSCTNCLNSVDYIIGSLKNAVQPKSFCTLVLLIESDLCPLYIEELLESLNNLLTTFASQTFCLNKFACSTSEVETPIFGCMRCASMVAAVKSAAITETGKSVLSSSFESFCNQSALNIILDCQVFGDAIGNRIIPDTFNGLSAVPTCNLLNACGTQQLLTYPEMGDNSTVCTWCESVVSMTFQAVELAFSNQHIHQFTQLICNFGNNTHEQYTCESKMMKTLTTVRNEVLRMLEEGYICKVMHICKPYATPSLANLKTAVFDTCNAGEMAVREFVESENFPDTVKAYAKFRCLGVFPFYTQCEKLFEMGAATLQHILSHTDSMCAKIFNVTSAIEAFDVFTLTNALTASSDGERIDTVTCEGVLNIAITFLDHVRMEKDKFKLVNVLCGLIPNQHQATWCPKAIQPMINRFLNSVIENIKPKQVCL